MASTGPPIPQLSSILLGRYRRYQGWWCFPKGYATQGLPRYHWSCFQCYQESRGYHRQQKSKYLGPKRTPNPHPPSPSYHEFRLVDVSSQNVSMSALNTSNTPNLVKVSSTVLLLTTLPSRTPRPLAPTSMSRESISNHVKLTPSNSSEKSQKLLLQSHTNSSSKLDSNKMGLYRFVLRFLAGFIRWLSHKTVFTNHDYLVCLLNGRYSCSEYFSCSRMNFRNRFQNSFSYQNSNFGGSRDFPKFSHLRTPRHPDCLQCNICRLVPSWSSCKNWSIDRWFGTPLALLPMECVLTHIAQWHRAV